MIELMQGDCLDKMRAIPAGSIDMVLADPPYGTTACKWDTVIDLEAMWDQIGDVLKPNGACVLTASQPFTSRLVMSNPKAFKYSWVWEKSKASNFVHAKRQPLKAHEDVLVFSEMPATTNSAGRYMSYFPQKTKGKPYSKGFHVGAPKIWSSGCTGAALNNDSGDRHPRSVQYFRTAESEGKHHPTQKPVALMEYLIRTYTNEGDTVLDFTMGSGTTGVACVNTGRKFIGIELDAEYFAVAERRIKDAESLQKEAS